MDFSDTIFACSSGFGKAGIAIIRVSGSKSLEVLDIVSGIKNPKARQVRFAEIRHSVSKEVIDKGIVIYFSGPESYTGEDVVEFQVHGGRSVLNEVLESLSLIEGLRVAEAGEFSRRSVLNGKMDLTSAEGVIDLINADTKEQRRQAYRQLSGSLCKLYEDWRSRIVKILAYIEAYIDFPEEDIPASEILRLDNDVKLLIKEQQEHLEDNHRGEVLKNGFKIAIIGVPNAGKSSLLNRLVKRDVAIVSKKAGTTRDVIEAYLDIGGYPVIFSDTAGLRSSEDEIEAEGIKRALLRAQDSDLILGIFDGEEYPFLDSQTLSLLRAGDLSIVNKSDLIRCKIKDDVLAVSALTGFGIDLLLERISLIVSERLSLRDSPALTSLRHREAISKSISYLQRSLDAQQLDLRAEDIRMAARHIGSITGTIGVEEVLDVIFKDFCIGK